MTTNWSIGGIQGKFKMPSYEWLLLHMIFGAFQATSRRVYKLYTIIYIRSVTRQLIFRNKP